MKHPAGDAPSVASQLFPGERLPLVQRYADLLATVAVERGLIGPRETPRLWRRHILNCALMAPVLPTDCRVADVGSGAGLPGVVLALARPDVSIDLIEPLLRRTTFLDEVVGELGLANVEVCRGRAEDAAGKYDVVTARAVAPLERLLRWCMPLVSPRGELVAMKGSSAEVEVTEARQTLRSLGCGDPKVEVLGDDIEGVDQTRLVRVTR